MTAVQFANLNAKSSIGGVLTSPTSIPRPPLSRSSSALSASHLQPPELDIDDPVAVAMLTRSLREFLAAHPLPQRPEPLGATPDATPVSFRRLARATVTIREANSCPGVVGTTEMQDKKAVDIEQTQPLLHPDQLPPIRLPSHTGLETMMPSWWLPPPVATKTALEFDERHGTYRKRAVTSCTTLRLHGGATTVCDNPCPSAVEWPHYLICGLP